MAAERKELIEKVGGWYFTQKNLESEKLYRILGVLQFKKYMPFNGDLALRRSGRKGPIRQNLESLQRFEARTRENEKTHVVIFGVEQALTTAMNHFLGPSDFWFLTFTAVNVLINGYPIMLQRYNRLRVNKLIGKMETRQINLLK